MLPGRLGRRKAGKGVVRGVCPVEGSTGVITRRGRVRVRFVKQGRKVARNREEDRK